MYQRTSVSVMQKEPGSGVMIQSYSSRGFNIDGNKVFGPCAVLPPAILQWNVSSTSTLPSEFGVLFTALYSNIHTDLCSSLSPSLSLSAGWKS